MSDQNEVTYEDGDVVWVKLGPCWWPGQVVGNDKLPPDILPSLRKTPIATVKFFQEDTYEYVKSGNLIFKYNCSRKNEFIKKGLQDVRRGCPHMLKFPADVSIAEKLTNGDPDLIQSDEFALDIKSLAKQSDSTRKPTSKDISLNSSRGSNSSSSRNASISKHQSGYTARILVQPSPVSPGSSGEKPCEPSTPDKQKEECVEPTTPRNVQQGGYSCHACAFTTTRLNVMILHNKSHSIGFIPWTPSPIRLKQKFSLKNNKSVESKDKEASTLAVQNTQKRGRRRKVQADLSNDGALDGETSSTPKRSHGKTRDKDSKKPKSEMEIKNSLLADWSEESDESMDILTSLQLTETQCALPEESKTSNVESQQQKENEIGESQSADILKESSDKIKTTCDGFIDTGKLVKTVDNNSTNNIQTDISKLEKNKDEEAKSYNNLSSCFDFKEEEEWPEEADIGRKIPRVNLKLESDITRKFSESSKNLLNEMCENTQKDLFDINNEVKSLLDTTKVPDLPSIPQTLKHQENFPEAKTIKFPDKKDSGDDKPPAKTIFKTKSFFRSRHSRSQDAIEKYIADNTNLNIDKTPSYIDQIGDADSSEMSKMTHDHVATFDLFESDPEKLVHSSQKIRVTKLAPKIQLKKMKAAAKLKQITDEEFQSMEIADGIKVQSQIKMHGDILGSVEPSVQDVFNPLIKNEDSDKMSEPAVTDNFLSKNSDLIDKKSQVSEAGTSSSEKSEIIDNQNAFNTDNLQGTKEYHMEEIIISNVPNDSLTNNVQPLDSDAICDLKNDSADGNIKDNINNVDSGIEKSKKEYETKLVIPKTDIIVNQEMEESTRSASPQKNNSDSPKIKESNNEFKIEIVTPMKCKSVNPEVEKSTEEKPIVLKIEVSKAQKTLIPNLGDIIRDEWNDDDFKDLNRDDESDNFKHLETVLNDVIPKNAINIDSDNILEIPKEERRVDASILHVDIIESTKTDEKSPFKEKCPSESDLQIAETLINLPSSALHEAPTLVNEDKNLNAAECLVQMSETLQNNETNKAESDVSKTETGIFVESQKTNKTIGNNNDVKVEPPNTSSKLSPLKVDSDFDNAPSKLLQMLEVPSLIKTKPNVKVLTTSPIQQKGKEKILNFGVASLSPTKIATVQPQKQKIIIRRTGTIPLKNDFFGDDSMSKSQKNKQNDDTVQTFTIQQSSTDSNLSNIKLQPKGNKIPNKTQKIITKPQSAIITSTGILIQDSKKKADESLFDINSMPIVLSDDLVTPENIDSMPIMKSDGTVVSQALPVVQKTGKTEIKLPEKADILSRLDPKSNIIIKQVVEKSNSPNILSKSSKMRSLKLLLDKTTGEPKLIMPKPDSTVEGKPVLLTKQSNATLTQLKPNTIISPQSSVGKVEKIIILPNNPATSKSNIGKRQQKIILNPQTVKAHMVVGKPGESADLGAIIQPKPKLASKIIANRPTAESTNNTVMIITNAQGVQSRIVLMQADQEKVMFPKKTTQSTTITPQTIVTSKGAVYTPNHGGKGRNSLVTSQSIISKGQILTTASMNTLITSKGHLVPGQPSKIINKQKSTIVAPKGQIIMSSAGKQTILTAMPGQAILTSKGQLITSTPPTTVTAQGKIIANAKLPFNNSPQMKLIKTMQRPTGKMAPAAILPQMIKPERLIVAGSTSHIKTVHKIVPAPVSSAQSPKEPVIILQQKSGNVVQLTAAQFEHLQKTGQIVPKLSAPPARSVASAAKPVKSSPSKFTVKSGDGPKIAVPESRKSGVSAVKHKLQAAASAEGAISRKDPEAVPIKKQRLRELLTKPEPPKRPQVTRSVVSETIQPVVAGDGSQPFENLDDLIPATTIQTQKVITDSGILQSVVQKESESIASPGEVIVNQNQAPPVNMPDEGKRPELFDNQTASAVQTQNANSLGDGQLLAVPGENFGGPPNSFFLCIEENGVITPVDNQALVLENNQLVPMQQPTFDGKPPATEATVRDPQLPISERLVDRQSSSLPSDAGQQNILINAGDQQILLDQQTLMSLLGGDGQQVVTVDGQQLVLQGNAQQILAALAETNGVLAPGQALDPPQRLLLPGDQRQLLLPGAPEGFVYEPASQHHAANQDILAAALANTDVFRQDSLMPESLNIAANTAEMLMEIDSLSPNFHNLNVNVSVHSNVSETSSTLNQPIMSPLEVPTKKDDAGVVPRNRQNADSLLGQNLEASLAVIGVTAPGIPTSLELPITVTNPHIAPKTTNPLNLNNAVYPSPGIIGTSMILPNLAMQDAELSLLNSSTSKPVGRSKSKKLLNKSKIKENTGTNKIGNLQGRTVSMPSLDDADGFLEKKPAESESYSTMSMPLLTDDDVNEPVISSQIGSDPEERKMPKSMPLLTDLDDEPDPLINSKYLSKLNSPIKAESTSPDVPITSEQKHGLQNASEYEKSEFTADDSLEPASRSEKSELISEILDRTLESSELEGTSVVAISMPDLDGKELSVVESIENEARTRLVALDSGDADEFGGAALPWDSESKRDAQYSPRDSPRSDRSHSTAPLNLSLEPENGEKENLNDVRSANGVPSAPEALHSPASASPDPPSLDDDRPRIAGEESNAETCGASARGEYPNPDALAPDAIPPTPPEPSGDNSHHLSETSSDASEVIPIQPAISVSHRLVQNFSREVGDASPRSVSNDASSDSTNKRSASDCDIFNGDSQAKKTKYDDEER